MGFLFVLTLIALSVVIGFLITDIDGKNAQDSLDTTKPENMAATTKKCPRCDADIDADANRCIKCGTIIMFYKPKIFR